MRHAVGGSRAVPLAGVVVAVLVGLVAVALLFRSAAGPEADNAVSVLALEDSEYDIVYLDAHGVFVVAGDDGPIALAEDAQHVAGDVVGYCPSSGTFLGLHGGQFDRRGRYISGPPTKDMDRVSIEVTGATIVVHVDELIPSVGRSASADPAKGPPCEGPLNDSGFYRP